MAQVIAGSNPARHTKQLKLHNMKKIINHYKTHKQDIEEIILSITLVGTIAFFIWFAIKVSHYTNGGI